MNTSNNLDGLIIRHIDWEAQTAGPSPNNNKRIELFLFGCKKAMSGNPCPGCFNKDTWDSSIATIKHSPIDVAEHIGNFKKQYGKYITIGGGEPTDQIDNLIILCEGLKKYGFHIIVYTWRELKYELMPKLTTNKTSETLVNDIKIKELLKYIDVVIDGQYKQEERLYQEEVEDGFFNSVGSGNQIIWDINKKIGYAMRDVKGLKIIQDNTLEYQLKPKATINNLI